jgi:hypothetical protein
VEAALAKGFKPWQGGGGEFQEDFATEPPSESRLGWRPSKARDSAQ